MKSKWLVLFLIWLMMLVAYFDRIDLSVAGTAIMASLHISKAQLGFVLSAFTLGYAVMQAPGGHFADRFGSRFLLIVAIIVWSIFTAITGLATSFAMMIGIRIVFGIGEGLENGAQFKLVGEYFKPSERSFANAVFLTALALGPALGTPAATSLIDHCGWRVLFYVFAIVGLVVAAVLIAFLPRDRPKTSENDAPDTPSVTFREVLRQPSCWLCAAGYTLFNMAFWGFLSWVPTYLTEERHITLKSLGILGALPYYAGFVGMLIVGGLGSTVFHARRPILLMVCYFAGAASLFGALRAHDVQSCVIGLCVAAFCIYAVFGPFWAIAIDLAPPKARGVFTGSVNCCGQVGAFISQIVMGILANRMKSFEGAILFMVGALVLGGMVMFVLQSRLTVSRVAA